MRQDILVDANADAVRVTAGLSRHGVCVAYLVARLTNFRNGRSSDTGNAFIMQGVAHTLDDGSMQAIAAWLNSLPPTKSL